MLRRPEIDSGGTKWWWNESGGLHREDGPAVEHSNGSKSWYINNMLHRENGPAIENINSSKTWYTHGVLHREDGPAIEYRNISGNRYYIEGKELTEKKFKSYIKLKAFW